MTLTRDFIVDDRVRFTRTVTDVWGHEEVLYTANQNGYSAYKKVGRDAYELRHGHGNGPGEYPEHEVRTDIANDIQFSRRHGLTP